VGKKKLVQALLLPHIWYCDVVYSGMRQGEIDSLQLIFNACTRFVTGRRKYDSIRDVTTLILGSTLQNYLKFRYVCFMKKIMNHLVPSYLFEKITFGRSQRNLKLIIPLHRGNNRHLSFFVQVAKIWNMLPNNIKSESRINKYFELCKEFFKC